MGFVVRFRSDGLSALVFVRETVPQGVALGWDDDAPLALEERVPWYPTHVAKCAPWMGHPS
jgi:hypothetical protein